MAISRPPYRSSSRSIPRLKGRSDRRNSVFFEYGTDCDPRTRKDLLYVDIINGNPDLVDSVIFRFFPSRAEYPVRKRKQVQLSDGTWVKRFLLKESKVHVPDHWSRNVRVYVVGRGGSARRRFLKNRPGQRYRERTLKFYEPRELRAEYLPAPAHDFGVEIETSLSGETTAPEVVAEIEDRTGVEVVDRSENYLRGTEDYSRWQLVPDGSTTCSRDNPDCNKFELVSRVLTGEPGLEECKDVLDALQEVGEASCNKSMGLHVHVSVQGLNLENLKNICLNFVKHEEAIDSFMPASRIGSIYCQSNKQAVPGGTDGEKHSRIASCNSLTGLCRLLNPGDPRNARYYKLNLQNLLNNGRKESKPTIEFRQHSCTTNPEKIEAWVRFCMRLVHNCRERPPKLKHYEDAFESLFDTVIEDLRLKDFYRTRRKKVASQNGDRGFAEDDVASKAPCGACLKGGTCEGH